MVEPPNARIGVGSQLGGRYQLIREVGRGGFGAVFEARDAPLNRSVAVKLIHNSWTEAREELEREATLLAGIRSPHVVRVLDASVMEQPPYLVMELLEGESVRARLDRGGAMDPHESFRVLDEVLLGLRALHARELVHGDLKPENVILCQDGAKLIDLGIARPWTGPSEQPSHVLGTPPYLAPELLRGGQPDARSDLYAAGLLIYELLTGYPAHAHREELMAITDEIREGRRAPLTLVCPWLPSAVSAFVDRALQRQPDARFQSADAMRVALASLRSTFDGALADEGLATTSTPSAPPDLGERFEAIRPLSVGRPGLLWEARDRVRDTVVTVRRLELGADPSRTGISQLAGLRSPHAPQIYDLVQLDPSTFVLVVERLTGRTLAESLGQALPMATLDAIGGQLLAGLAAAHGAGLVHGALAPSSVVISHVGNDSIVKLLGFGLGDGRAATALDPEYVAPELVRSALEPTFRSDVYSVGAILFALLTGTGYVAAGRPLEGASPDLRALGRVAAAAPITGALGRALALDPARRFADARAFLAATREAAASESA